MTIKQAVIMAGGKGTRLRPVTNNLPKAMVPANDKPFLEHLLIMLKKRGVTDIVLCVSYLGEQIKSYFGDGTKFGLNIVYSYDGEELLGTGGALKKTESLLNNSFFFINGDVYYDLDYRKIAEEFEKNPTLGLMVVYHNRDKITQNNVIVQKGKLLRYDRDRIDPKLNEVDGSVYVFKKEILDMLPEGKSALEIETFQKLIDSNQFRVYMPENRYYTNGTPEKLKLFEKHLREGDK